MLELGQEGKDKITGFIGILTARVQYITGCDCYDLTPKQKKAGEPLGEIHRFDEDRIEIIGKGINKKKVQGKSPGAEHRESVQYK